MKKAKIMVIALFAGILGAFFLVSVLLPQKDFSVTENRLLEQRPELLPEDILSGDYQETYETYLNDQFVARDRWVDLAVNTEKLMGRRDVNGIYVGKDGYLLEKYDDGDFDARENADHIGILGEFLNEMTAQYGAEHVDCLFVPGKAAALPDKLPGYAAPFDEQEILQAVCDELERPEIVLDLTQTMNAHEDEYIYYRTDHHWTTLGAYYAYAAWCEKHGRTAEPLSAYERETVADDFYGTSYNKSHQNVQPDTVELFHRVNEQPVHVVWDCGEKEADSPYQRDLSGENDKYRAFFDGNTAEITIDTDCDNQKTLLLLKDSYANCFVPFLFENYSRIVMIDLRYQADDLDDILAEESGITDVMVLYNVEKFLQDENIDLLLPE